MKFTEGEYYDYKKVESFAAHGNGYKAGIIKLSERCSGILDPSESKTFVLGGIYPHNSTKDNFIEFVEEIHKPSEGIKDRHIIIDVNSEPLNIVKEYLSTSRSWYPFLGKFKERDVGLVQADLKKLPFKKSIDFLFLDMTLSFVPNDSLQEIGHSIEQALTDNGVAFVVNNEPFISKKFAKHKLSRLNRTEIFPKWNREIISGFSNYLKPSLITDVKYEFGYGSFSLIAFSRYISMLGKHEGPPIAIES